MVDKIKDSIKEIVKEFDGELFDLELVREGNDDVLRILVDKDGGIDLDTLVGLNQKIGDLLDNEDLIENEYLLEVSSPGAERPIRNEEELIASVGKYVFVKTFDQEYTGDFLEYINGNLVLKVNLKGRIKKVEVSYMDVQSMRLSVKF